MRPTRQKQPGWITGKGMSKQQWTAAVQRILEDIATGNFEYMSIVLLPFPYWLEDRYAGTSVAIAAVEDLVAADPRLKMVKNYVYQDIEIRRKDDERIEGADQNSPRPSVTDQSG